MQTKTTAFPQHRFIHTAIAMTMLLAGSCAAPEAQTSSQADSQPTAQDSDLDTSKLPAVGPGPTTEEPTPTPCVPELVVTGGFETGAFELDKTLRAAVTTFAGRVSDSSVLIEGHTDSTPVEGGNQQLSERRAEAVADALIEAGVPQNQIETIGRADNEPIEVADDELARAANRRVELYLDCAE